MLPFTPSDVIFTIGSYRFGTETFFTIIALIVFILLSSLGLKKEKIFPKKLDSVYFVTIVIFSAYLGGRIWAYVAGWYGPKTVKDFFSVSHAGLTSLGFFIGAAVAVLVYVLIKFKKENKSIILARIFDVIAIPAALTIFILRLGCFFDGHVIGKVTSVPWCVFKEGACRHPVALYLALSALVVFFVLVVFFGREKKKE